MAITEIVLNINASRICTENRIITLFNYIELYTPGIVCIQEIDVRIANRIFKRKYQVFCNYDQNESGYIGVVTLIRRELHIMENIYGIKGRIIGVKLKGLQIWNVYPPSGSNFKLQREAFFREELCNLMMNWKDHTKYIIQAGDHNCTHRKEDSINNPGDHIQPGLIAHLKVSGLKDSFLELHGSKAIQFSRVTNRSSTRIDYIFSNVKCISFEYVDANMNFDHKVAKA